ncbi:MAG: radical SAM protein [Proteobacteria bacterium]|nr:radical SAM protein [Pseudomonadota bacterium]
MAQLDMELTERCNNNCIHCYINLPENDRHALDNELSTDDIKDILKQAEKLGCLAVRFTGGEPLVKKDFKDIYLFARQLGLKVVLFTNASLIDDEMIRLFSHIPPLKEIEITVYGMTQSSYEAVSGVKGSFKKAFEGIRRLNAAKIPFIVKGALLSSGAHEQKAFETFADHIPWMKGKPDNIVLLDLSGRRDLKKNDKIRKLRISPDEHVRRLMNNGKKLIEEGRRFQKTFRVAPDNGDRLFTCGAGKNLCVDAYGNLQACLLLRHPDTVYDLKKGTLKDAFQNFFPELLSKKAENPEFIKRCGKCELRGFCEQCPAKSWMEHGTLDTPVEYYCRMAHAEAEMTGLDKDEIG